MAAKEKNAELFDLCKTAAAMKQIQPADLLKTAKADGGEITVKWGQISIT